MTISNAELRREVRAYLAERPALAHRPDTIARKLRVETGASLDEIQSALAFLVSLDPPHADAIPDPDGADKYYRITAVGTLAHERSGL